MSQELYEHPRSKFSQGDILEVAPHVFLDPPLLTLEPSENGLYKSEGEPFSTFDNATGQRIVAKCKRTAAMILTPDCEIDKEIAYWHLCPVVPLSRLKPATQGHVKRNRIYSMFFLPRFGDALAADSFVDFNHISTVGIDFIKAGNRVLSLSDLGRHGLYQQFIRWFTRWELRELSCPNCSVKFSPSASLSVRSA